MSVFNRSKIEEIIHKVDLNNRGEQVLKEEISRAYPNVKFEDSVFLAEKQIAEEHDISTNEVYNERSFSLDIDSQGHSVTLEIDVYSHDASASSSESVFVINTTIW